MINKAMTEQLNIMYEATNEIEARILKLRNDMSKAVVEAQNNGYGNMEDVKKIHKIQGDLIALSQSVSELYMKWYNVEMAGDFSKD